MTTTVFAAKVKKIRNNRKHEYFIHRVNIPSTAVKEMGLKDSDYLLIKAKKAEWYDLIDWSKSSKTFESLPSDLKRKIEKNQSKEEEDLIISRHLRSSRLREIFFAGIQATSRIEIDNFEKKKRNALTASISKVKWR